MATLTLRRRQTKSQRAASVAGQAGSAAWTFAKARIAWALGKRATKVALPAAAFGTAAIVAKKHHHTAPPTPAA